MDDQMATDDNTQQGRGAAAQNQSYGTYQARQRSDVQYLCAGKRVVKFCPRP